MQSGNLIVVAEVWMLLCTISIPHVEASISRVLATSTIHKRHWGLSFSEHKRTMGRIKEGNLHLNHTPMILNLILSHNSVSGHFCKQHGNLYMTAKLIFENSTLLENAFLIWHRTH